MEEVLRSITFHNPRHVVIGVGGAILTLLLLNIGNFIVLRNIDAETQSLYQSELLPLSHIKEANSQLFDIERNLKQEIIAGSPSMRSETRKEILTGEKNLWDEIAKAKTSISRSENQARITLIENLYQEYKNNVAHAMMMMEPENIHGDNPIDYILSEDFQKVVRSTDQLLDEIAASKLNIARERVESARIAHERTRMISLLILVATLFGGVATIRYFIVYFVRPFAILRTAADALSSGSTDITIPYSEEKSPVGEMARAINRIRGNIRAMERRLNTSPNLGCSLPSVTEGAIEPGEQRSATSLLKRPVEFGSQSSPLCRSSHDYMTALGESLYLRGELIEAEKQLHSALVLLPSSTPALSILARILYGRGIFKDAETCLRRVLGINPSAEDALYLLSLTLASTSRAEDAEVYQRKLLSINPWHEGALMLEKHFLSQKGRFEQAETVFKRAIAINPKSPTVLSELANLRKMTLADTEWMIAAEELVKFALPRDEVQLRFAMGKYCDDIKDYDRAFSNYLRANQLSKAITDNPFLSERWTRTVDRLIQINSRSRASQVLAGSSASQRPVFIVGMPRSGTSLVEQIIASHPAVFGAGELLFWRNIASLKSTPAFESLLSESLLSGLAEEYLGHLASLNNTAIRVVDKMPDNFICVGLIHAVFPNAKFIHTQRNPIDTCLSIYFQNFSSAYKYQTDLPNLAHYYREYHRLMAHWHAILPGGTVLELRYEDLLADQEGLSRRTIEFIGLDWDERCLNYQDTERRVATASKWQVRQKIYKTSVERWRNYEKFIGPLMELQNLHY